MKRIAFTWKSTASVGLVLVSAVGLTRLVAQGQRSRTAQALFDALDTNGDGTLTQNEMQTGFESWFKAWNSGKNGTLTQEQIAAGLSKVIPGPPPAKPGQGGTFNGQGNSTPMTAPEPAVAAMMKALPTTPGAKPLKPRKVLVLAHTGPGGFVHASIPRLSK